MRTQYPRTPHLPWSPGASSDDVHAVDLSGFAGREVVITEKLDGENTTLYHDGLHARSLDSAHHPSRAWVKALHGRVGRLIPPGWRVCGENMFARHSIAYHDLDSWFYAFSVWDGERCLDWDTTVRCARRLGVPTPPVLWRGAFDERTIRAVALDTRRQEGYVVRTVEGFTRDEFAGRLAKWVRPSHVTTSEHWMLAPVVPNGLGPAAALWTVRSGGTPDPEALRTVLGLPIDPAVLDEVTSRLDLAGRTGDTRLAGVLAAMLHTGRRAEVTARLAGPLGMGSARRIGDLLGQYPRVHLAFPDERRRAGLIRMSVATDLATLHALAIALAPDQEAREQAEWSALVAQDAGLLERAPLESLRLGLQQTLRDALADADPDVADRCWAQARDAYAEGRITTVEEAAALTWRWRDNDFPRVIVLCGPSGSGKSRCASTLPGVKEIISLDDLRERRGSRADQRANPEVLRQGLHRLDAALAADARRGAVVWDATALNQQQRGLVHAVAARRNALVTHAVLLVEPDTLIRRNRARTHAVPDAVLDTQLARFSPPYPGEAHRTWYVGAAGSIEDVAGTIDAEEP